MDANRAIPLDKLQYILDLIDVKYHRTTNVYVANECNVQIEQFEKDYNVCFVNEYMFIEDDDL